MVGLLSFVVIISREILMVWWVWCTSRKMCFKTNQQFRTFRFYRKLTQTCRQTWQLDIPTSFANGLGLVSLGFPSHWDVELGKPLQLLAKTCPVTNGWSNGCSYRFAKNVPVAGLRWTPAIVDLPRSQIDESRHQLTPRLSAVTGRICMG